MENGYQWGWRSIRGWPCELVPKAIGEGMLEDMVKNSARDRGRPRSSSSNGAVELLHRHPSWTLYWWDMLTFVDKYCWILPFSLASLVPTTCTLHFGKTRYISTPTRHHTRVASWSGRGYQEQESPSWLDGHWDLLFACSVCATSKGWVIWPIGADSVASFG